MNTPKEQIFYVAGALILVAILFFGFDTKPSTHKALEKSRALSEKSFDTHTLETEARKALTKEQATYVETLGSQLQHAADDSAKVESLKALSGFWYEQSKPILAGAYARQVAEINQDAISWSIAGTTFVAALKSPEADQETKEKIRDQAVEAFENAISLEPTVVEHRVNQALSFIEAPDVAQPMKGIQMLAGLATSHPESALPPYHLARLAVQTGQMDRAEERIEQALTIDSTNARIACLAIEIYRANQKNEEAGKLQQRCAGNK